MSAKVTRESAGSHGGSDREVRENRGKSGPFSEALIKGALPHHVMRRREEVGRNRRGRGGEGGGDT